MRSSRSSSRRTSCPCMSRQLPARQMSIHPSSALISRLRACGIEQMRFRTCGHGGSEPDGRGVGAPRLGRGGGWAMERSERSWRGQCLAPDRLCTAPWSGVSVDLCGFASPQFSPGSRPASCPGVRSARSGPKSVSGNTVEARDAAGGRLGATRRAALSGLQSASTPLPDVPASRFAALLLCRPDNAAQTMTLVRNAG